MPQANLILSKAFRVSYRNSRVIIGGHILKCFYVKNVKEYSRWRFRRGIADEEGVPPATWPMGIAPKWGLITISIKVLGIRIAGREDGLGIVEDGSIVPRHSRKILPGFVHQQSAGLIAPLSHEALDEISLKSNKIP